MLRNSCQFKLLSLKYYLWFHFGILSMFTLYYWWFHFGILSMFTLYYWWFHFGILSMFTLYYCWFHFGIRPMSRPMFTLYLGPIDGFTLVVLGPVGLCSLCIIGDLTLVLLVCLLCSISMFTLVVPTRHHQNIQSRYRVGTTDTVPTRAFNHHSLTHSRPTRR